MRRLFGGRLEELDRRLKLFDHCGIERRRIALPVSAHLEAMGFGRRNALRARARPGSSVLLVVVELCWLTLRCSDGSLSNLVACALFDDGVIMATFSAEGDSPRIDASGETRFPGTLEVMGWLLEDDGLGVLFSPSVPDIACGRLVNALSRFLARHGLDASEVDRWLCYPGGTKVLAALERSCRHRRPA